MKKRILAVSIICTSIFLFHSIEIRAYDFDFVTVSDIVGNVKKKFGSLKTYQAHFKIVARKMGKTIHQSGIVKYKATDKLRFEFHQPHGQRIISNGRTMWIYIPSMNVVAEQGLKEKVGIFSSSSKSGLRRLFSKYHYRFASKEQPEVQKDGSKQYTLLLKQRESRSGYRTIRLWISENYYIVKAKGETSSGKVVEISFSGIKTNINMPSRLFKFDIPSRARVIKNPLREQE